MSDAERHSFGIGLQLRRELASLEICLGVLQDLDGEKAKGRFLQREFEAKPFLVAYFKMLHSYVGISTRLLNRVLELIDERPVQDEVDDLSIEVYNDSADYVLAKLYAGTFPVADVTFQRRSFAATCGALKGKGLAFRREEKKK